MSKTPYLRWIVSSGEKLRPAFQSRRQISHRKRREHGEQTNYFSETESEVHTTDQMIEIYTSGSMALPKGVKHTHGAVVFRAHYITRKKK